MTDPKTSGKIVIALQFWQGDKEAAMRNARRMADAEPEFRKDVEFLFVSRFDCEHDDRTVRHVGEKFRTSTYRTTRRGTGWPGGCNDMWSDLMTAYCPRQVFDGKWNEVKAVLTLEADCIPVAPDWLNQLSAEWDVAAKQGKYVVGCLMPGPKWGPYGHINGNALFTPDLFMRHPSILGCPNGVGWDQHHATVLHPHWYPTPLITNYYHEKNVDEVHFRRVASDGRVPVLIHGVKDMSCENYADRMLARGPEKK